MITKLFISNCITLFIRGKTLQKSVLFMPIGVSYDPITETVRYTHTHKTGFRAVTSEMTEREREVDNTLVRGGVRMRGRGGEDRYV